MEAICKLDYLARLKAKADAEAANRRRQRDGGSDKVAQRGESSKELPPLVVVPKVGFHDIYGVWFHGRIVDALQIIGRERFGAPIGEDNHVFISREPNRIGCGVHEIQVYGMTCRLYKWRAQGYHRGLVVLADDEEGKEYARIRKACRTWSWVIRPRHSATGGVDLGGIT